MLLVPLALQLAPEDDDDDDADDGNDDDDDDDEKVVSTSLFPLAHLGQQVSAARS